MWASMPFDTFGNSQVAVPDEAVEKGTNGNRNSELAALGERLDQMTARLDRLVQLNAATASAALPDYAVRPEVMTEERQEPLAAAQFEAAIFGLRSILSCVARDDALARLSDEVRGLAAKIEHVAEAGMRAGADTVEQELSRANQRMLGSLEDRVVKLVEKLDACDSQLSHFSALERGLADLLINVSEIKRDIAEIRDIQAASERHAINRFQALHGTLSLVSNRLAAMETGMSREADARPASVELGQPPKLMTADHATRPAPHIVQANAPGLPPDFPLEPRTCMPRPWVPGSPADRLAASEAALDPAEPSATAPGHPNFIMAARRAAQAGEAPPIRPVRADDGQAVAAPSGRRKFVRGLRSTATAISVLVIVLGAVRVAMDTLSIDLPGTASLTAQQPAHVAKGVASSPPPPPASAAPGGHPAAIAMADDVITTSTPPSGLVVPHEVYRPASPMPAAPLVGRNPDPQATGSIVPLGAPSVATPSPTPPAEAIAAATDNIPANITSPILRAALAQGDPTAEYELALRYAEGRGVPQNLEEAARWFDRAANAGLVPAQFRLGSLYEKGTGVKKDLQAARRLYVSAAEKGNAEAMHNLAVLIAEGVDGKPDYKSAVQWFRKAAAHGVGDSQYNLGILYGRGIGVEQNLQESFKWFSLAAAQGDQEAAKKRDEMAARLDQKSLRLAKIAIQTWVAEPQPEAATKVPAPAGGWEKAPTTQPGKPKPRPAATKGDPL
jgi:localization factor PodJL